VFDYFAQRFTVQQTAALALDAIAFTVGPNDTIDWLVTIHV
jgi:hypothetical protein